MGPLSGIGDSIFWGVLRVIAAGIGISLASQGSIFGPLLFLLIYNIPAILTRYYLTYMGFTLGDTFIQDMYKSGSMQLLNKAASTLGLMMIGCMTATMVAFKSKLAIPIEGGKPIEIQTYLDQLWQGLVPLAVTLGCYWLLSKKVNVNWILLGVLVLAIVLGLLGVV
jgi:PTS system mannose-specific IID component